MDERDLAYLKRQVATPNVILLTGAGFSAALAGTGGVPLPLGQLLARELWENIAYPDEDFDASASLADVYSAAIRRSKRAAEQLLQDRLTAIPESCPDSYAAFVRMPWKRWYTLNVDNVAEVLFTRHPRTRTITLLSGVNESFHDKLAGTRGPELEVVHLNGLLRDSVERTTFSQIQYGERLATQQPLYAMLSAELLTHCLVVIGSPLDEPSLWQHLQFRRQKGPRGRRELRPRSFLITPNLPRPRAEFLEELNIHWVQMTSEDFATKILGEMQSEANEGLAVLERGSRISGMSETAHVSTVAELRAAEDDSPTEFLLGEEPQWKDIAEGKAVRRDCDVQLSVMVEEHARAPKPNLIVVTGTAGSGKSTSLRQLALELEGRGEHTFWMDATTEVSVRELVDALDRITGRAYVFVDDADLWGDSLVTYLGDLVTERPEVLPVLGIRSTRAGSVLSGRGLQGVGLAEFSMPFLTDRDIDELLSVLARENRLGNLRDLPIEAQRAEFGKHSGRILIVAMLKATRGEDLKERIKGEFRQVCELGDLHRDVYMTLAFTSSFRIPLTISEVLEAVGEFSNEALNVVDDLCRNRRLVRIAGGAHPAYRLRHRRIADIVVDTIVEQRAAGPTLKGLAFAAAVNVRPGLRRSRREFRLLKRAINHEFLMRVCRDVAECREIYASLEGSLGWDYHFWLQRGSLELQLGSVALAGNFVEQAYALNSTDPFVNTAIGYVKFKRALQHPDSADAAAEAQDAEENLLAVIRGSSRDFPHAYHVLASQGLAWSRRSTMGRDDRVEYLRRLFDVARAGSGRFPLSEELASIATVIQREMLLVGTGES